MAMIGAVFFLRKKEGAQGEKEKEERGKNNS